MTDPVDPIAELTEKLAAQEQMFLDAISDLSVQVAALQQAPPPPPAPAAIVVVPRTWQERATSDEWDALKVWVTGLNANYSLMGTYAVPACWAAHPGLVEELAALQQSWTAASLAEEAGMTGGVGSTDMSGWFKDALWPCLDRLKATSQRYQTTTCSARDHKTDTPAVR